jgi:hypothetical protein
MRAIAEERGKKILQSKPTFFFNYFLSLREKWQMRGKCQQQQQHSSAKY